MSDEQPLDPTQETTINVSRRGGILLLELRSADGLPRLTRATLKQLRYQVAGLTSTKDLTAAVITGTEKCFAAGAELTEIFSLNATEALRFAALGQSVMRIIEQSRKPIIAAIRGYCMGGGFDLALACHARIAAPIAIFAHRGAAFGIITGWGGTQRLPRILGPNGHTVAMELMTTGRTVDSTEALQLRLITRIVTEDHLLDVAMKIADDAAKHQASA